MIPSGQPVRGHLGTGPRKGFSKREGHTRASHNGGERMYKWIVNAAARLADPLDVSWKIYDALSITTSLIHI